MTYTHAFVYKYSPHIICEPGAYMHMRQDHMHSKSYIREILFLLRHTPLTIEYMLHIFYFPSQLFGSQLRKSRIANMRLIRRPTYPFCWSTASSPVQSHSVTRKAHIQTYCMLQELGTSIPYHRTHAYNPNNQLSDCPEATSAAGRYSLPTGKDST